MASNKTARAALRAKAWRQRRRHDMDELEQQARRGGRRLPIGRCVLTGDIARSQVKTLQDEAHIAAQANVGLRRLEQELLESIHRQLRLHPNPGNADHEGGCAEDVSSADHPMGVPGLDCSLPPGAPPAVATVQELGLLSPAQLALLPGGPSWPARGTLVEAVLQRTGADLTACVSEHMLAEWYLASLRAWVPALEAMQQAGKADLDGAAADSVADTIAMLLSVRGAGLLTHAMRVQPQRAHAARAGGWERVRTCSACTAGGRSSVPRPGALPPWRRRPARVTLPVSRRSRSSDPPLPCLPAPSHPSSALRSVCITVNWRQSPISNGTQNMTPATAPTS
jgi:hypothetical protein